MMLMDTAVAWVQNQNREVLGSFAVDPELLARRYAIRRVREERNIVKGDSWDDVYSISRSEMVDVVAECLLWEYKDEVGGAPGIADHEVRKRYKLLKTILTHPERLPYYEVGVFDVELINQCVADGIDAEMARVLCLK